MYPDHNARRFAPAQAPARSRSPRRTKTQSLPKTKSQTARLAQARRAVAFRLIVIVDSLPGPETRFRRMRRMNSASSRAEASSESRIGAATQPNAKRISPAGLFLGRPQCLSSRLYGRKQIVGAVDCGPDSSIAPASSGLRRHLGCAEPASQVLRNNPDPRRSAAESTNSGNS